MKTLREQINELRELPEGWDGQGSDPIPEECIKVLEELIETAKREKNQRLFPTQIFPMQGGLAFVIENPARKLKIEVAFYESDDYSPAHYETLVKEESRNGQGQGPLNVESVVDAILFHSAFETEYEEKINSLAIRLHDRFCNQRDYGVGFFCSYDDPESDHVKEWVALATSAAEQNGLGEVNKSLCLIEQLEATLYTILRKKQS